MSELRAPTRASTRSLAFRYAAFYGAVFLVLGIYMPFWPVFLKSRGLDAAEIGLIFALVSWIRIVTTPAIAQIADRSGRAKATLVVVAALSLVFFIGFFEARGFWPILLIMLPAAVCFQPMIPLAESQTMAAVLRERLDYGRIRLWGSLAFILGTVGAGFLITGREADLVLILVLGALALTVLAALALPVSPTRRHDGAPRNPLKLLRDRRFLLFLGAASLLQASHAVYYGFSALHWQAAGLSEATIGWLWAEGVVAEVLLFAFSGAVMARASPAALLALAALAAMLRWTVLAASTDLALLIAVQALHGLTFGAAHLGAMHFLARAAPPGLAATAQSLYSAVAGGTAMGLAMLLAGVLYDAVAGQAFLAMTVLSAVGLGFALVLARASRSEA